MSRTYRVWYALILLAALAPAALRLLAWRKASATSWGTPE